MPDREKRLKTVEMAYGGNLDVIQSLLTKKALIEKGDPNHESIKTALILMGGGQKSIVVGGACMALEQLQLTNSFDHVLGTSAGAVAGYYLVGGNTRDGAELTTHDVYHHRLIDRSRLLNLGDYETAETILRSRWPIDHEGLRNKRPNLLIGLTNMNGQGTWVSAREVDDPINLIIASSSHPLTTGGRAKNINGEEYIDGCIANPLPIKYAAEQLQATDIIAVLSRPPEYTLTASLGQRVLEQFHSRHFGPQIREALATYEQRFLEEADLIAKPELFPKTRILAIYPQINPIEQHTSDSRALWNALETSRGFTYELITGNTHQQS